jgi:hypothetical protein
LTEVRVLTVKQPWAWAIIHGGKDVENRVRNLAGGYRGPVAIHAGKEWDASSYDSPKEWEIRRAITSLENGWAASDGEVWGAEKVEPDDPRFVRSAIIGVVDLTGVHRSHLSTTDTNYGKPVCFDEHTPAGQLCSPWAEQLTWHLELSNARALTVPMEWKGALGLRRLPLETAAIVRELQRG